MTPEGTTAIIWEAEKTSQGMAVQKQVQQTSTLLAAVLELPHLPELNQRCNLAER